MLEITFVFHFSCFLSLLLIAALFWKVKQRYDAYIRRQVRNLSATCLLGRPPHPSVCPSVNNFDNFYDVLQLLNYWADLHQIFILHTSNISRFFSFDLLFKVTEVKL
jgi:hypothetical protein